MNTVLLLQPPSNWQALKQLKSRRPSLGVPLPLVYIAPYLLSAGFEVHILDMRLSSLSTLRDFLREKRPVLAGITTMPGSALLGALRLSRLIKACSPKTPVVWGGFFPSLYYDLCLTVPEVDFVVCGDGEETLTDLALALCNGGSRDDLTHIPGLALNHREVPFPTPPRTPVELDRRPVGAWHLLDRYMPDYLGPEGHVAVNTARGCPYRCSFCYNNVLYQGFQRYRTKSVPGVLEDLAFLTARHPVKVLRFWDDNFLGDQKRALELAEALQRICPGVRYHIAARADALARDDFVRPLAEAGLASAFIGAESGSEELLERIEKGSHTTDTLQAARVCRRYNVVGTYSFTCGYPHERPEDLYATVRMADLIKGVDPRNTCYLELISPVRHVPLYTELCPDQLERMSLLQWCHLTDWKSAQWKTWIRNPRFYEAFQLAFLLAFTPIQNEAELGLRSHTQLLARWSRRRLCNQRPRTLPEFQVANALLKAVLWHR